MAEASEKPRVVGRYVLHDEIASGGMATVHLGRLLGPVGFARTVAIKRLHPQFSREPEFVSMFLDEARLAARIRHPNVVSTLDVVAAEGELFLVLDYVQGESFSRLLRAARQEGKPPPLDMVSGIVVDTLLGLHAAHTATDELGNDLDIVHRDVSPQNILVGTDGIARVLDFGIAKATSRLQTTRNGQIKGKLAYMSPEQVEHRAVDARTDIFAMGVVLWEALVGERLFASDNPAATLQRILSGNVTPPGRLRGDISPELDAVVMRALSVDPAQRFGSAREMATLLESVLPRASALTIGSWVERTVPQVLDARARRVAGVESQSLTTPPDAEMVSRLHSDSDASVPQKPAQDATRTDLSVSRGASNANPSSRRAWLWLALVVLVVGGTVVFVLVRPAPNEVPPAPEAATAQPSSIVPSAVPESVAALVPSASASAQPRSNPTRSPARLPAKPNCKPPYYFDKNGNKHFKTECYEK
jgi:serine/threonine protein kinase